MDNHHTQKLWDLVVVGAGPAGLAAAVNGLVRKKSVVVLGVEAGSGRLRKAPEINNYPGLPGISGEELQNRLLEHARSLGMVMAEERVENIYPGQEFACVTRDNRMYRGRALILATGIRQSRYLPGEEEFLGHGVGYCATCDGAFYRDQEVAVIGETPEAEADVNFLAEICRRVHFFPRYRGDVRVDQKVDVRRETPKAISGQERVTGLTHSEGELPVAGVFIIREVAPIEQLVAGLELREGSVLINRDMETNIPGVFAAGDCTGKPYQVGKAVGEGLTAALSAARYLDRKEE